VEEVACLCRVAACGTQKEILFFGNVVSRCVVEGAGEQRRGSFRGNSTQGNLGNLGDGGFTVETFATRAGSLWSCIVMRSLKRCSP
jgi:hypothetical protein